MIYEIILSDILYPKGLNADRNGAELFNMMIKEIMEGKHIYIFFLYILPNPLASIISRCALYTLGCRMKAYK